MLLPLWLQAQLTPIQYNSFENTLNATLGTNATTVGTPTYAAGQVGKCLFLGTASKVVNLGNVTGQKMSIEFMYKPSYGWDRTDVTTMMYVGSNNSTRLAVQFNLNNLITATPNSYNTLSLNGIGRKNYAYYTDTATWKHIVLTYDGAAGKQTIWVNGQLLYTGVVATGSVSGLATLSADFTYSRMIGYIDEVAIYNDVLQPQQIYQDYLYEVVGSKYPFTYYAGAVPPAESTTALPDVNEFPIGFTIGAGNPNSIIHSYYQQLRISPLPRYSDSPLVQRNYNIGNIFTESGNGNTLSTGVIDTMRRIQREMARNYYYGILGVFNQNVPDGLGKSGTIQCANENTEFTLDCWTNYAQMTDEHLLKQTYPAAYYVRNNLGQFLQPNGGTGSFKWIDTYTPNTSLLDSIKLDGKEVNRQLRVRWIPNLTRPIDRICDNGENMAFWLTSGYPVIVENLASAPTVAASQAASGLTWNRFKGRQWSYPYKLMADSMRAQVPTAKVAFYNIAGDVQFNSNWYEARNINSLQSNGFRYSTLDFYPRYPSSWRVGYSAYHGLDWIYSCRAQAMASGDSMYSPFIAAGWEANGELDMRPSQYLGILKTLSAFGVDFFYSGYWDESNNNPSKGWCWQFQIPSYAQAVNTKAGTLFTQSKILTGDVPLSFQYFTTTPTYAYYAGDQRIVVNVRKSNTSNKYLIYGSLNAISNMTGAVESSKTAHIVLAGQDLFFEVRRQGSVYVFDNTGTAPIFYQVDKWHEYKCPERWSTNIAVESELPDVGTPTLATSGNTGLNFTTYDTYTTTTDTLSYNVKVRQANKGVYYLFIRAKAATSGAMTVICKTDTQYVDCIGTSFGWYAMKSCATHMKFTLDTNSVMKFIPHNSNVAFDQFVLSTDSNLYTSEPSCGTVVATITGNSSICGGTTVLDAGVHTSYLWSTSATTRTVTVAAGTYTCTVTDGACTGTATKTIRSTALPSPTITGISLICSGNSVVWTASSATTYLWSTAAVTSSISVSSAGTYTLTVTDAYGCTGSTTKVMVVSSPSTATITGSTYFCGSQTLTASAGTSYLWSTGAVTSSISVSATGTYSVTVTTTCAATASKSVRDSSFTITMNSAAICASDSALLETGDYQTYVWSTGSSNDAIYVTAAGVYTVTVSNGVCTASATGVVSTSANPSPSITASSDTSCNNVPITLTTGSYVSFVWSNGSLVQTASVITPGTYTVTVTNSGGCSATASYVIKACRTCTPVWVLSENVGVAGVCNIHLVFACSQSASRWQLEITRPTGEISYRFINGISREFYLKWCANKIYRFRVRAVSANGTYGAWSLYITNRLSPINTQDDCPRR